MAEIMASSISGCKPEIDKTEPENASDKIYLQNEENMELVVIGLEEI